MKIMKQASRGRLLITTSVLALTLSLAPLQASFDGDGWLFGVSAAHAECCFTGETLVTMADGAERPIRLVRAGDWVMSRSGGVNRVRDVEIVPLAGRRLHSVNNGAPFFTAEHPFLTPAGWKALDPAATALETPLLRVSALAAGDLLSRLRPRPAMTLGATALAADVALEHERVLWFGSVAAPAETVVYNLILAGDHSYVANGYVVHNKGGDGGGDGGGGGGGSGSSGGTSGKGASSGSGHGGHGGANSSGSGIRAGSGGGDFHGSAEPAGPDLSHDEERNLISRGWQ